MTTTMMTRCEHYWREGVLLVERGRPDPHRDDCLDCRREHEARGALVRALQQVGAGAGDPRWQAKVWARIDRARAARTSSRPVWLPWASALAAACVLVVFVRAGGLLHREREDGAAEVAVKVDIAPGEQLRAHRADHAADSSRSRSAAIGDHVRAWIAPRQEARLYRGEALLARCAAAMPMTPRCADVGVGVIVDQSLDLPGKYQLVIAPAEVLAAPASGEAASPDRDLAALTERGVGYELFVITVR
jgi:hypothetical protein